MVGLVVVSHSARAAAGIAEVAGEMGGDTRIEAVGGDGQDGLGTVPDDIETALAAADEGDGVVVLVDLGSAVTIPAVKARIVETDTGEAAALAADALTCSTREDVRALLELE